jgi:hypothetical protein
MSDDMQAVRIKELEAALRWIIGRSAVTFDSITEDSLRERILAINAWARAALAEEKA